MTSAKSGVPEVSAIDTETDQVLFVPPSHPQAIVALLCPDPTQLFRDCGEIVTTRTFFPFVFEKECPPLTSIAVRFTMMTIRSKSCPTTGALSLPEREDRVANQHHSSVVSSRHHVTCSP